MPIAVVADDKDITVMLRAAFKLTGFEPILPTMFTTV